MHVLCCVGLRVGVLLCVCCDPCAEVRCPVCPVVFVFMVCLV